MTTQPSQWRADLSSSALLLPQLQTIFNLTETISLEMEHQSSASFWLDSFCGIDAMVKTKDNQVYGVAVRNQYIAVGQHPYNSFTIRSGRHTGNTTELAKRMDAIENGYLYPRQTIQAYFEKGTNRLLSAASILTKDLYEFCKLHSYLVGSQSSDNDFKVINWSSLAMAGYSIQVVHGV
jgi:hypothetical protein